MKSEEKIVKEILEFLDELEIKQPDYAKKDNWRNWKYIRNSIVDKYNIKTQPYTPSNSLTDEEIENTYVFLCKLTKGKRDKGQFNLTVKSTSLKEAFEKANEQLNKDFGIFAEDDEVYELRVSETIIGF